MLRKLTIPMTLAAAALLCCGHSLAEPRTIEHTFDVSAGGTLYLRTDAGSIDITTHNADSMLLEVDIDGRSAEDFEVRHEQNGNDVNIYGEMDRNGYRGWGNNLRVEFTLTIPETYELDLQTSGGSIDVEDLTGNIEAETSGGSINIGNVNGDIDIKTSGGSIHTEEIAGNIDAHTSGGSVHVEFSQQLTEDAELSTSGGSITAILPEDVQLDIKASTSGGRVKSDFDVDGRVKKQSISGEINGGGPRLDLHTSGGNIRLKAR